MTFDTRLFVGNLPEFVSENELLTEFSSYGTVNNVDLKYKPGTDGADNKKFAFITLSANNPDIESCIQHFSSELFKGNKLYVTRARESFLERLQRERQETLNKKANKNQKKVTTKHPVMKISEKPIVKKRQFDENNTDQNKICEKLTVSDIKVNGRTPVKEDTKLNVTDPQTNIKKNESDKKRLESLKKKRQDFKDKQKIIKTGLIGIDKAQNKKTIFTDDNCDVSNQRVSKSANGLSLFDEEDSDGDVNFDIKKQFEGKNGQKILELQSRFKSDKRFKLDERFIEDDQEDRGEKEQSNDQDEVVICQSDEKAKQLNILQDILGYTIKSNSTESNTAINKRKLKTNAGMLRFDPMQPEHAKFLAPIEKAEQVPTKNKKKKLKDKTEETPKQEVEKVEVSKEQFYKVTDSLKEAIAQPNTFSLRSLFTAPEDNTINKDSQDQELNYMPLEKSKESKIKNPLDNSDKNPFKYDSSDSETEDVDVQPTVISENNEVKAVWSEKLFFSSCDSRLNDGLAFFYKPTTNKQQKDRREMKSIMKKRLHNQERKDQSRMFKKKIGGKRKSFKKNFRRKT